MLPAAFRQDICGGHMVVSGGKSGFSVCVVGLEDSQRAMNGRPEVTPKLSVAFATHICLWLLTSYFRSACVVPADL